MCGIGGYAVFVDSKNYLHTSSKLRDFTEQLVFHNTVRGADSTGIYGYDLSQTKYFLDKKLVEGTKFKQEFRTMPRNINDYHVILTHNRKATVGGITVETAHPLKYNNCVLTHNGTMGGFYGLKHNLKDDDLKKRISSDSMFLAYMLGQYTLDSFIDEFYGAYALAYHYVNDPYKLYLTRNKERTLYTSYIKYTDSNTKYDAIAWASEGDMLAWLLGRNGIGYTEPKLLTPNKLVTVDLRNRKSTTKNLPEIDTSFQMPTNNRQQPFKRNGWYNDDEDAFLNRFNKRTSNSDTYGQHCDHSLKSEDVTPFSINQKVCVKIKDIDLNTPSVFHLYGDIEHPQHKNIQRHIKITIPEADINGIEWELYNLLDQYCVTKIKKRCTWLNTDMAKVYDVNNTYFGDKRFFYYMQLNKYSSFKKNMKEAVKEASGRVHALDYVLDSKRYDAKLLEKMEKEANDLHQYMCEICGEEIKSRREMGIMEVNGEECLYKPIHEACASGDKDEATTVH